MCDFFEIWQFFIVSDPHRIFYEVISPNYENQVASSLGIF
jgi:hypothetical protein